MSTEEAEIVDIEKLAKDVDYVANKLVEFITVDNNGDFCYYVDSLRAIAEVLRNIVQTVPGEVRNFPNQDRLDFFAAAALTGLLTANPHYTSDTHFSFLKEKAMAIAEEMVK